MALALADIWLFYDAVMLRRGRPGCLGHCFNFDSLIKHSYYSRLRIAIFTTQIVICFYSKVLLAVVELPTISVVVAAGVSFVMSVATATGTPL